MSEELVPTSTTPMLQGLVEFGSFRSPDAMLKEAQMVASAFQRKAISMSLYQPIGESKHLKIEGWQMLASMYRVTAGIVSDRYVEYGDARGFEATAEAIYVPTGQRISTAFAMCLNDEDKWGAVSKYEWQVPDGGGPKVKVKVGDIQKPLQQLRSMAQTRAISKVYSNLLKWVAKMAGFSGTPAEEIMPGQELNEEGSSPAHNEPRRADTGPVISEAQGKRFFALAKASGKSKDIMTALLKSFGFEDDRSITKAKYEAVCNAVQDPNWKPPAAAPAAASQTSGQPASQTSEGSAQTSREMWAEVIKSWGSEEAALICLSRDFGFERFSQVNAGDMAGVAMKMIQRAVEARR